MQIKMRKVLALLSCMAMLCTLLSLGAMSVFVKSFLCGVLTLPLLLSGVPVFAYTGSSSKALTAGADIRVMSYNVTKRQAGCPACLFFVAYPSDTFCLVTTVCS